MNSERIKNHFKIEVWIMWLLAAATIAVAFVAALTVPNLASWH